MPGKETNPYRQTGPQTFRPQTLEPDPLVHPQIPNKDKRDGDIDRNPDRKPETQTQLHLESPFNPDPNLNFTMTPKTPNLRPTDPQTHQTFTLITTDSQRDRDRDRDRSRDPSDPQTKRETETGTETET